MIESTGTTVPATCRFPGCARPPRAASGDGRGARPKYCDLTGENGKLKHTALSAFRERERFDRRAAAGPADLDRPVTMATARAGQLRTEITDAVDKLTLKLTAVMGELERIADPEAAEAQIEAVQAEAAAQVADARSELAREAQRRQSAEADAEEARAAALEMDVRLRTAEQARASAEERAEQAADEITRITQESTEQVQAAQAEVQRARNEVLEKVIAAERDRDERVQAEHAEADRRVAEARAGAERQVEQARAQAAEHVVRTDRTVRDSQAEVARARQAEADARASAAEIRQEMTIQLADQRGIYDERIAELTLARDEARDRARRAETELDNLTAHRDRLASRVEDPQVELAQARVQLAAQGSAARRGKE